MSRRAIVILLLFLAAASTDAQPQLSGFLTLDKRISTGNDDVSLADFYNRFRPELSSAIDDRVALVVSMDARFHDLPDAETFRDLENAGRVFPLELTMWEAFSDIYGLFTEDLDVRIGKQRIAWGRADRFNPTDNLNPDDFSDLVEFGDRVPVWAARGTYYVKNLRLTAVWIPSPSSILLPVDGSDLLLGSADSADDLSLEIPNASSGAFRFEAPVGSWDASVSYLYGFDDVPRLSAPSRESTSSSVFLPLPRFHVVGADAVRTVNGAGLWIESAFFIPVDPTIREDAPYVRWTLGSDYTFEDGTYANGQWVHGFSTENGGSLNDYGFAYIERDIFGDDLRIRMGGAVEFGRALFEPTGFGFFPELTWQAIDNFELALGAFFLDGEDTGEGVLGAWKGADQVFLRTTVHF